MNCHPITGIIPLCSFVFGMNSYIKAVGSNHFIQNTFYMKKEIYVMRVRWYLIWILKVKQQVPQSLCNSASKYLAECNLNMRCVQVCFYVSLLFLGGGEAFLLFKFLSLGYCSLILFLRTSPELFYPKRACHIYIMV